MKVLIVDDSRELLTLLKSILERMNHEVQCVTNKADALSCTDFDLAMIDWNLEDGCGFDLVEVLALKNKASKFILMSATKPSSQDMSRLTKVGASFEAKPLTPMRLMQIAK